MAPQRAVEPVETAGVVAVLMSARVTMLAPSTVIAIGTPR
jgi:hypothetical protein